MCPSLGTPNLEQSCFRLQNPPLHKFLRTPLPVIVFHQEYVIERILHLKNFRTFNAANDIAREIYDRWVCCNVYPIHLYTISKKVQSFVNCFSALDRWSKKKRGEAFLQKEKEFMSTIDEIFDVFVLTISSAEFWRNNMV